MHEEFTDVSAYRETGLTEPPARSGTRQSGSVNVAMFGARVTAAATPVAPVQSDGAAAGVPDSFGSTLAPRSPGCIASRPRCCPCRRAAATTPQFVRVAGKRAPRLVPLLAGVQVFGDLLCGPAVMGLPRS